VPYLFSFAFHPPCTPGIDPKNNGYFPSSAEGLVSYIIPKGVQRGNEVELIDKTYDGDDEGDRLVSGLGQLVDGQKGMDNFRSDVNGFGKGEFVV
jgi:hypothetical protein